MTRERFAELVAEALDSLPARFRRRIENAAVVIEDRPAGQSDTPNSSTSHLLMGVYEGVPATERSVWDAPRGPDRIVLYQENIEAICQTEDEIREEVRLTVVHELGHYFGLNEDQLKDV